MMARYYSSSLGRFMAVDPGNDTNLEDPQSWNRYIYVRNNPLTFVDPTGKATEEKKTLHAEASSNNDATKGEASAVVLKGKVTGSAGSVEVAAGSASAEVHQGSKIGSSAEASALSGTVTIGKPGGVATAEGTVKMASVSAEGGVGGSATTEKLGVEGSAGATAAITQGSATGTISVGIPGTSMTFNITATGEAGVGASATGHAGVYLGTSGGGVSFGAKMGAPLFTGGSIGVSIEPASVKKP
jgi:uncharacterized protein RhaS with RHS repeats